jgi:hypothetical protein
MHVLYSTKENGTSIDIHGQHKMEVRAPPSGEGTAAGADLTSKGFPNYDLLFKLQICKMILIPTNAFVS